jgi:hypothetical protein
MVCWCSSHCDREIVSAAADIAGSIQKCKHNMLKTVDAEVTKSTGRKAGVSTIRSRP